MKDKIKMANEELDKKISVENNGDKIYIYIFVILLICFFSYFLFIKKDKVNDTLTTVTRTKDSGKMIFLLMGVDNDPKGRKRSDTMMLAFVNTYTKKIQLLSVPRDTRVFLEKKDGYRSEDMYRKINAAFVYGGIDYTRLCLEKLLNINIDAYIKVDIDGFVNIIDVLGGIDIDVEEDMHYIDKAGELYINIKKGMQHFDGRKAMYYVRYRDKIYADIGRIKRQQNFLKEVLKKIKNIGIIWKIPNIIQEIYKNIDTDMGIKNILSLVKRFREFDLSLVKFDTLPGQGEYVDKVSYYIHNTEKTEHLIEEIMQYEADMLKKRNKNEVQDTEEIQ